jgi:hypothetical protein
VAEEAVCPNFSPRNSLLTGENTGNFADSGSILRRVFPDEAHLMGVLHRRDRNITGIVLNVSGN